MPFQSDSIMPSDGLDKDIDLALLKKGSYIDALNVQHITDGGQTSYAIQNTKGNLLRFTIPATTQQNKKYSILIQISAAALARQVTIYDAKGVELSPSGAVNWVDNNASLATSYANFLTALNAVIAATIPAQTRSSAFNGLHAIVGLTTVNGFEFTIRDTGTNITQVDVIQEAIDLSLTGDANIIGSYDLLGDLFIYSTPQKYLPDSSLLIAGATNTDPIIITTTIDHGLTTGQSVGISGIIDFTEANGTWVVNVINANSFELSNSNGTGLPYGGGGTVTINANGIGEIGVAVYNPNTDITTYTTLLKSKELNFHRPKQIDCYSEENNFQSSHYYTDFYNVPRVFYYSGPFIANGGIQNYLNGVTLINNPQGKYSYGTIADESKLIITNESLGFGFTQQLAVGGSVKSGNWRYAVRLLTATFSATNWTQLTNPISVFKADPNGNPDFISGDDPSVISSKINEFSVTNIPTDVFFYIELAGVNYVGGAIVGSILNRFQITGTSMTISHTGNENNVTNLDVTTLNQFSADIRTARNIDAIDNRLILSCLTTSAETDFSAWTRTWTHSVKRTTIQSIGVFGVTSYYGEYQVPANVYGAMGLMHNELYRYSAKIKMKDTGNFTKNFYIDDIVINTSSTNVTVPDRRVAGLPDLNLTPSVASALNEIYVAYVEFSGIDLNYLIDGVPAKDLIESIHIEAVERGNNAEVLATGVIAMTATAVSGYGWTYKGDGSNYGEYPFISGDQQFAAPSIFPGSMAGVKSVAKMYSPDIYCGEISISRISGDVINCLGNPELANFRYEGGGTSFVNCLSQYNGYFTTPLTAVSLDSAQTIGTGPNVISISGINYDQTLLYYQLGGELSRMENKAGLLMNTTGSVSFPTSGANADYGLYYGQYFRPKSYSDKSNPNTCKYGNLNETIYVPTGAYIQIVSSTTTPASISVYGGDTFTQKSYLKHRGGSSVTSFFPEGGGGIGFYSQNVVNAQMMRKYNTSETAWQFPLLNSVEAWLKTTDTGTDLAPYNDGYTIKNGVNNDVAFDVNLPDQSDLPTRIVYSDLKPQNSVIDNFRTFLPLNFLDLPLTFGPITHHMNFNGELFTWQPRRVQRQYFNTRGTMNVNGGSGTEVLIGDGSVLSRPGQTVTVLGTNNKWSVLKGKSAQGGDVAYWINTEQKQAMRMGYDGTIRLANIYGLQSFFANNLKWVNDKDIPADGQGICGVTDDRYLATIWTVRGKREIQQWEATPPRMEGYSEAEVVSYTPTSFSTFEETGEFYVSLIDNNTALPTNTTYWVLIPHTGSVTIPVLDITINAVDYYNEYTIEFNEQKNKFTTFYTFKPKIYLKWADTFLSPRPISNTGSTYEHRLGNYCEWYSNGATSQTEPGSITMVFNQGINNSKEYLALWFATEIVPSRVDLYTKNHQSFLLAADYENNLDYFTAAIKNDILTSSTVGAPDEDTSKLFGQYIKIKLTFSVFVYQKAIDVVLKYFSQSRMPNR